MTWAQRLKRVFNIDIETCRECGDATKVIACIEDPVVIQKILDHLKEKGEYQDAFRLPESRDPPSELHHAPRRRGLHPRPPRCARVAPASDAMLSQESRFSSFPSRSALHQVAPTTTASADFSLAALRSPPFQALGEISPGKNAILPRTTARSTRLRFDHKSFAVTCLLALLHRASYPVLVHRLTVSFHASFPRSVALTQLHFLSFAVVSSRLAKKLEYARSRSLSFCCNG